MNLTREEAIEQLREALEPYLPNPMEMRFLGNKCRFDDDLVKRTIDELAQAQVDIYNWDLLKWVAAEYYHHHFIEDAIEEYGWEGVGSSFLNAIGAGQHLYARYRFQEAWEVLKDEWEASEEEEDYAR